jgi:hypothetical protein
MTKPAKIQKRSLQNGLTTARVVVCWKNEITDPEDIQQLIGAVTAIGRATWSIQTSSRDKNSERTTRKRNQRPRKVRTINERTRRHFLSDLPKRTR